MNLPLEGAAVLCELNLWAVIIQEGNQCHPVQPPGTQPAAFPGQHTLTLSLAD